ncbi:MAG: hypothetical protein Q8P92_00030 [Candidatus Daviesbacteria bacterium]|nr:hypothetical protein [Candidatus Daviesbacteria bacterium]
MDRESTITPEVPVSHAQKERGRYHDPIKYVKLTLAGALGLAIGIACNPAQSRNINITESPIVPTATATFEPSPTVTSTPEVKKIEPFDCKVLRKEACASGRFVQFEDETKKVFEGVAFTLEGGEELLLPFEMQVAMSELKEPNFLHGMQFRGRTYDGKRSLTYYGDLLKNPEIFSDKKTADMKPRQVVATGGETGLTVFEGYSFNALIGVSAIDKETLPDLFDEITEQTPLYIPYSGPDNPATSSSRNFDIPLNK